MNDAEAAGDGSALASIHPIGLADDRLLTFLFTDIVGSTRMWEQAPTEMAEALERHDHIVNASILDHGGSVFATGGDGVAAVFDEAHAGLAAAVQIQVALIAEEWPERTPIRVRMGLHAGTAQRRDGDFFGPVVNRAARVMSTATGGQIVASEVVAQQVPLANDMKFVDLGSHDLKGLSEALRLFGVDADTHPWGGVLQVGTASALATLPLPVSEWFGPMSELSVQASELARRRLVSIVGPGGTGKTRTALELSQLVVDSFPDGVWMVELLSVDEPDAVAAAVASALGVRPHGNTSTTDSIVDWLSGRQALLIIDNCEHVIEAAAELVGRIVTRCPETTVLATSREHLGITGERVIAPPALAMEHATALFRERAVALDATITFDAEDEQIIQAICKRLDRIPLALEIAAARLRSVSLSELESGLRDRFRILKGSGRGIPKHHRTLHGAVDWSYQLMEPEEQQAFLRLSVFAGWFDFDAVEAVIEGTDADAFDVVPALVDKSMVVADRDGKTTRFRLLETLREFATAKLVDSEEHEVVQTMYRDYVLDQSLASHALWTTASQLEADATFDQLWDDLRAVHVWACETGDVEYASRIIEASFNHAHLRVRNEHAAWAIRTTELHSDERPVSPVIFALAAWWAMLGGRGTQAIELAEAGAMLPPGDSHGDIMCHAVAGFTMWSTRRADEAGPHLDVVRSNLASIDDAWMELMLHRSLAGLVPEETNALVTRMGVLAESLGSPALIASARFYQALGATAGANGYDAATALHREGVVLARASKAHLAECQNLQGLQATAHAAGHPDAIMLCRLALRRIYELSYWLHLWPVLMTTARDLIRCDDLETAALILGFLEANQHGWSDPRTRRLRERSLELIDAHHDGDALLARGADADRDAVVAAALDGLDRLILDDDSDPATWPSVSLLMDDDAMG